MKQPILFFILLCASLLNTTNAMESPTTKSTTKQKPKKSLGRALSDKARSITRPTLKQRSTSCENKIFQRTTHDQRLPSLTEEENLDPYIAIDPQKINEIHGHGETLLLWAARNNKPLVIKKLLVYDDIILINHKNYYNKTALHYLAQHKNEELIKQLLHNPRTDASLVNGDNKTAREMVKGNSDQDKELRHIIFARIMLDLTVNNIYKNKIDECIKLWLATTDLDCKQYILHIFATNMIELFPTLVKNALTKDQNNQKEEDRNLPDSTKLPDYADDDFIKQMMLLRIAKGSA